MPADQEGLSSEGTLVAACRLTPTTQWRTRSSQVPFSPLAAGSSLRLEDLSGRQAGCSCSQHKGPHLLRDTPTQLPS